MEDSNHESHRRFREFSSTLLPAHVYETVWEKEGKVTVFDGDIEQPRLGLSEDELAEVTSTATIYIHAASSINLQRSLASISRSVVTPTLTIADIALSSPQTRHLVYISTAYANSHFHTLHAGIDTYVSERIYPLRPSDLDSTELEYADLLSASSTTPEFRFQNFPFPYAYAKHFTERLLQHRFNARTKPSALLILRPSIFGSALYEPYPYYETPGSAPATALISGAIATLSLRMDFASRFPDQGRQSNLDEMLVDFIANRLLMYLSRRSSGLVHAVAGIEGRRSFASLWQKAMSERRGDVDWRDRRALCPIARAFVVIGTSFAFASERTEALWELAVEDGGLTVGEKERFPCWLGSAELLGEVERRRGNVRMYLGRYFRTRKWRRVFVDLVRG